VRALPPSPPGVVTPPRLSEQPDPVARTGEVLLAVRSSALNRADLLQIRGLYPPPPGESEIPGLEAAGEVLDVGAGVEGWRAGDRVAALLAGGGHAERVAVPAGQLLPLPDSWSFEEGAALPEAAITAWTNLVVEGKLQTGETVLVSGATSGVGYVAVQLARHLGAEVVAAGRDLDRLTVLRDLGASVVLLGELPQALAGVGREGVDLVMDLVGGEALPRLLACLRPRGRLVLVGLMAGRRAEIDLAAMLRDRLEIRGSVLRPRSRGEKSDLVAAFRRFAEPLLVRRQLLPRIDRVFPFERISEAYDHLANGRPLGKVVLRVDPRVG